MNIPYPKPTTREQALKNAIGYAEDAATDDRNRSTSIHLAGVWAEIAKSMPDVVSQVEMKDGGWVWIPDELAADVDGLMSRDLVTVHPDFISEHKALIAERDSLAQCVVGYIDTETVQKPDQKPAEGLVVDTLMYAPTALDSDASRILRAYVIRMLMQNPGHKVVVGEKALWVDRNLEIVREHGEGPHGTRYVIRFA